MFGYIGCIKENLDEDQQKQYQSIYCGLCRSLKERYGQMERMCLSYDMAFLILLLSSLYEPEERSGRFRCSVHPLGGREETRNRFTDYAADMTIILPYYKCRDDWEDEGKRVQRWYARSLEKKCEELKMRYPRQWRAVAEGTAGLEAVEKKAAREFDRAINCSGQMLSELFVCGEDFWSDSLRTFGCEIGRFIYLMDAAMDYEKDEKKGNYNPLFYMRRKPEDMRELMEIPLGNAMRIFEKLPLIQDAALMRHILYRGVWQQHDDSQRSVFYKEG